MKDTTEAMNIQDQINSYNMLSKSHLEQGNMDKVISSRVEMLQALNIKNILNSLFKYKQSISSPRSWEYEKVFSELAENNEKLLTLKNSTFNDEQLELLVDIFVKESSSLNCEIRKDYYFKIDYENFKLSYSNTPYALLRLDIIHDLNPAAKEIYDTVIKHEYYYSVFDSNLRIICKFSAYDEREIKLYSFHDSAWILPAIILYNDLTPLIEELKEKTKIELNNRKEKAKQANFS